jgi:hypothetical protein
MNNFLVGKGDGKKNCFSLCVVKHHYKEKSKWSGGIAPWSVTVLKMGLDGADGQETLNPMKGPHN